MQAGAAVKLIGQSRTTNDASAPARKCNTDNGSFCGHVYVSPHVPNPERASLRTYENPVSVEQIVVKQHTNGINCLRVELDGKNAASLAPTASRVAAVGIRNTTSIHLPASTHGCLAGCSASSSLTPRCPMAGQHTR